MTKDPADLMREGIPVGVNLVSASGCSDLAEYARELLQKQGRLPNPLLQNQNRMPVTRPEDLLDADPYARADSMTGQELLIAGGMADLAARQHTPSAPNTAPALPKRPALPDAPEQSDAVFSDYMRELQQAADSMSGRELAAEIGLSDGEQSAGTGLQKLRQGFLNRLLHPSARTEQSVLPPDTAVEQMRKQAAASAQSELDALVEETVRLRQKEVRPEDAAAELIQAAQAVAAERRTKKDADS